MKSKYIHNTLAVVVAVLLGIPGCLEQKVKTTVSSDGTCVRTMSITADSGRTPETKLPLPSDRSWSVRWDNQDSSQKKGFVWKASKEYPDLAALAADTTALRQPGKIRITIYGGTSFRWFYTYFHYREIYHRFSPFDRIAPSAVLTDAEIGKFTAGEGGDTLRDKVEQWKNMNLGDFFVSTLDTLVSAETAPPVPPGQIMGHRADILVRLLKKKDIDKSLSEYVPSVQMTDLVQDSSSTLTGRGLESMRRLLVEALGTESARKLPLQEAWSRTITYYLTTAKGEPNGDFENVITLPGLFLDANSSSLKGNSATWTFKPQQIELTDYEMYAESRIVNTWAFVVSGLLVAGLVLVVALSRFRRTRK
jgi:hypothetical protein